MRKLTLLLVLTTLVGGCGFMKRTFGIQTEPPAYREPGSTAVWGAWVLRTPDSTAFVGAETVQLDLRPGTFTLTAFYPATAPVSISGTANMSDRGVLTLVPGASVSGNAPAGRALHFLSGKPITLLASASGNTLVFSPEDRDMDPTPSSVWHRLAAAREAGMVRGRTASSDSARVP